MAVQLVQVSPTLSFTTFPGGTSCQYVCSVKVETKTKWGIGVWRLARVLGCRKWSVVRQWFYRHLSKSLQNWQNEAHLIYSGKSMPNMDNLHIMGFHPHGMYPLGAVAIPLLSGFQNFFPGCEPATLAASSMFIPPIQRDLLHWWGVREVSRSSFVRALREEKSVIVCPGGQEELVETYKYNTETKECIVGIALYPRISLHTIMLRLCDSVWHAWCFCPRLFHAPSTLVLCTRHKGFVRIAIEQQAHLVPILALGEALTVRNALDLPKLQTVTYRKLGFPIPYLLVGRWGISPLPKKMPLVYVMGEPIKPPYKGPGKQMEKRTIGKWEWGLETQIAKPWITCTIL